MRLAVEIPSYARAAKAFQDLTKIPISASSMQRLVMECGSQVVEQQAEEAEATSRVPDRGEEIVPRAWPKPDSPVMSISLDGSMVNIRGEGWKEVKVATVSAVEADEEGGAVHLRRHSYRAGLWEAATFAKQQWAEAWRRGIQRAQEVLSINDGALWIWKIIAMCYAPCVEIIDWWHAVEKLWAAANPILGQGQAATTAWVESQKSRLWQGQLRLLVHHFRALAPRGHPLPGPVWEAVSYIYANRRRMRYDLFRQAGYPLGSGAVESGCKRVVIGRLRQAGMRWSRTGAQAMLALRCVLLSGRWSSLWYLSPQPT